MILTCVYIQASEMKFIETKSMRPPTSQSSRPSTSQTSQRYCLTIHIHTFERTFSWFMLTPFIDIIRRSSVSDLMATGMLKSLLFYWSYNDRYYIPLGVTVPSYSYIDTTWEEMYDLLRWLISITIYVYTYIYT